MSKKKKGQQLAKATIDPKSVKIPVKWSEALGPGRPAPSTTWASNVQPRTLDYLTGINRSSLPRLEDGKYGGVSFDELRWLSRENALVRGAIEQRKQQLQRLSFSFRPINPDTDPDSNEHAKYVKKIFEKPDGRLRFKPWLNMLAEDCLVLDNNYIYPRELDDGRIVFQQIDPSTVKRYVDERGESPIETDVPAYAQIIRGFPSAEFAFDQLYASQRNPSTDRLYGYSPVEQVADFISLAIRRLQYQEAYYTEGNVPETMVALPPKYGPDQVAEFQQLFDDLEALDVKRRVRMMPGGTELLTSKDQVLKDATDEWVARVICWVFQVPASALITDNNRATAESSRQSNLEDGLVPFMDYIKQMIDDLIVDYLGIDDVEFTWEQDDSVDALTQSQIDATYLDRQVIDINEVRTRLGYKPKETVDPFGRPDGQLDTEGANRISALLATMGGDPADDHAGHDHVDINAQENKKPIEKPQAGSDGSLTPQQVTSIVGILSQISSGSLPAESATALLVASFPALTTDQISAMVSPIQAKSEPTPPEPTE